MATGPGGIVMGDYNPQQLSNEQRQWLWQQSGKAGEAPAGYGGEGIHYTSPGGPVDAIALQRQQMDLMREANKPAIQSLEASLPEITSKYATERTRLESEKTPLEQRYNNLLAEITRQGNVSTGRVQTESSREFGKRGISLQSGIYDQALSERLQPITEWLTGQKSQASTTYEDNLRQLQNLMAGLAPQEIESKRQVQNAIANLQSGAAQSGVQNAMQMLRDAQAAEQANRQYELQKMQTNLQYSRDPLDQAMKELQLQAMRDEINRKNTVSTGGGGGSFVGNNQLQLLQQIFG